MRWLNTNPAPTRTVPPALVAKHRRRVAMLLLFGSSVAIVVSTFWACYLILLGQWTSVPIELMASAVGVACVVLIRRDKLVAASALYFSAMFVVVCAVSVVLDNPSPQIPRVAHHFLLPLGTAAYLMLRGSRLWWWRHGVPAVFFAAFCLLDSNLTWMTSAYNLTEDIRAIGLWVTNGFCMVSLYLVLHVMQADVVATHRFEADLRQALVDGQFILHYQPQIGSDGHVMGAEALVRWVHPKLGMVPPNDFIPLAEETGLILPLGDWVLKQACVQLAAWAAQPETASLKLAVNVSARQFRQPDFVLQVLDLVERCGIEPNRLKLELTESMLVNDMDDIVTKMTQLKERGVGFSLDDFGTGYSSLSYLKRLPLDQLKIDRAFVKDLLTNANDAAIAQTVVSLGQALGMEVIAEGVETQGQRDHLIAIGCDAFQGYYYSKPLTIGDFDVFVKAHTQSV